MLRRCNHLLCNESPQPSARAAQPFPQLLLHRPPPARAPCEPPSGATAPGTSPGREPHGALHGASAAAGGAAGRAVCWGRAAWTPLGWGHAGGAAEPAARKAARTEPAGVCRTSLPPGRNPSAASALPPQSGGGTSVARLPRTPGYPRSARRKVKNPIIRGQQRSNKRRPGGSGQPSCPPAPRAPSPLTPSPPAGRKPRAKRCQNSPPAAASPSPIRSPGTGTLQRPGFP